MSEIYDKDVFLGGKVSVDDETEKRGKQFVREQEEAAEERRQKRNQKDRAAYDEQLAQSREIGKKKRLSKAKLKELGFRPPTDREIALGNTRWVCPKHDQSGCEECVNPPRWGRNFAARTQRKPDASARDQKRKNIAIKKT